MSLFRRVISILSSQGPRGLARGIRDWVLYSRHSSRLVPLWDDRGLRLAGTEVRFKIYNQESFRRSLGHGEQAVIRDFVASVDDSDTVWDVGANQGTYSLFAASVGAEAIAFEPNPEACKIISRNANLNNVKVKTKNYGLGEECKEMILRSADRSGIRSTTDSGDGDVINIKRGEEISISEPDVLKVDVEGDEVAVLKGIGDRIQNVRTVYVEWHDDNYEIVREKLRSAGFKVEDIEDNIVRGHRPD